MRKAKLMVLLTMVLSFSLAMMPAVTGKTSKEKKGSQKSSKSSSKKSTGGNLALGAKVFDTNCATCHDGGGNTIEADKTLKMDALKANAYKGVADVKTRVIEGKGIMPAFQDQLKPAEIDAVSAYVWAKAQKDWK